jgi:hypothetical protein
MLIYAIMRLKPEATLEALQAHGAEEARAVWSQIKGDTFRKVSLTTDKPGAVVEIEAPDVAEAKHAMESLPLVRHRLVEVEYLAVGPYRNLETIFAA